MRTRPTRRHAVFTILAGLFTVLAASVHAVAAPAPGSSLFSDDSPSLKGYEAGALRHGMDGDPLSRGNFPFQTRFGQQRSGAEQDSRIPGHYIVVLKDSVKGPAVVAENQTEQRDGELGLVYRHALKGYSAELSMGAVKALRNDPRVKYVQPDYKIEALAQTTPRGISRVFATENAAVDIDEKDDVRVDVDVAVLDTGIDQGHPDLNVVGRTNCVPANELVFPEENESQVKECIDNQGTHFGGHATHVAGTIGALDNDQGVVGMAPGARLWSVKVLGKFGGADSWIIAGIDWVTATREDEDPENDIEVANMSIGCNVRCHSPADNEAIEASVEQGVVYVVAAGSNADNAKYYSPASSPDVITVAALNDTDGKPGSEHHIATDDTLAGFSNFGDAVEAVAPGTNILSTWPNGTYHEIGGTSMASPHVAGAAAILAAESEPQDREDVEAIRQQIVDEGSLDWTDLTKRDKGPASLLYVGDSALDPEVGVSPPSVAMENATLYGAVNARGLETEYEFEYGPTESYGQSVPVPTEELLAGSGYVRASETAKELDPGTIYHYRLVATNEEGSFASADRTFTTRVAMPVYSSTFGPGSGEGELGIPMRIAADAQGNIWVSGPGQIKKFNQKGEFITGFGSPGSGDGQFGGALGIEFDDEGDLWVAENNRIQQFNSKGEYLSKFGSAGSGNGQFNEPSDVAVDAEGDIWVADRRNERIQQFSPQGEYMSQFEVPWPTGIAIDAEGDIWVATYTRGALEEFSPEGEQLSEIRNKPPGTDISLWPTDVVIGTAGYDIWVAYANDVFARVERFTLEGESLGWVGESGWEAGQFDWEAPTGIAVGVDGSVWAVDPTIRRVQQWSYAEPQIEAENYPVLLSGEGDSAIAYKHISTKCTSVSFEDEITESANGFVMDPTYAGCKRPYQTGIDTVTVDMNSCAYEVDVRKVGPPYAAMTSIGCEGGDTIEIDVYGPYEGKEKVDCTTKVGPQVLRGSRLVNHDEAEERGVELLVELKNVKYTHLGGCGLSAGTYGDGVLTESIELSGFNEAQEQVGVYVEGKKPGPEVFTDPPSGVKPDRATLRAAVNANNSSTSYRLEYGKTTSYGFTIPSVPKAIGSGVADVEIEEQILGLEPETTYHFRVVAVSSDGTVYGADREFQTLPLKKPTLSWSYKGSGTSVDSAVVAAQANPNGSETTYQFEYGKTAAYGTKVPASPKSIGSGTGEVGFFEWIKGSLAEGTTYHFRIVLSNVAGTTYGSDKTFTTLTKNENGAWLAGEESEEKEQQPRLETDSYTKWFRGAAADLELDLDSLKCTAVGFWSQIANASPVLPMPLGMASCVKSVSGVEYKHFDTVMNSCGYNLAVKNEGPPYVGALKIACGNPSDQIKYKTYTDSKKTTLFCEARLGAQEADGIALFNDHESVERKVKADVSVGGLKYEIHGPCVSKSEMRTDGTMNGDLLIEALEE